MAISYEEQLRREAINAEIKRKAKEAKKRYAAMTKRWNADPICVAMSNWADRK